MFAFGKAVKLKNAFYAKIKGLNCSFDAPRKLIKIIKYEKFFSRGLKLCNKKN